MALMSYGCLLRLSIRQFLPRSDDHWDGPVWPERNLRLRNWWAVPHIAHSPALHDSCDRKHSFHPGEALTDALPTTATERKVDELVTACPTLWSETVGVETKRVGEEVFAAMHDVLTEEEVCTGRDTIRSKINRPG